MFQAGIETRLYVVRVSYRRPIIILIASEEIFYVSIFFKFAIGYRWDQLW